MDSISYTIADKDTFTQVDPTLVEGSGKSRGGKEPKEAKNTLKSNAVATVMVAVSEGEIGGWVSSDPRKDIFFDQTPLMNDNGTLNFEGVSYGYRVGLPSQAAMSGVSGIENTLQIGTQVKYDRGPIVRAVSSKTVDAVRVVIEIPSLVAITKKNGDQNETSIQLAFSVFDETRQVWESRGVHTIAGKCTAPYQQAFRLTRPSGSDRWLVKVERLTADSNSSYLQNDSSWAYMSEIENDIHTYDNTAYVMVRVSIDKFGNNIPKLSFRMKGIKCRVPVNYDQTKIGVTNGQVYSGTWNGSWKREPTDNPVWQIYELITNERYGMAIDESYINAFEWLPLAKYADGCDNTGKFIGVPDGKGGKRPRFTVRTQITSQQDALAVINAIASSMRAMTYWGAGSVNLSLDMPKDPSYSFGETSVVDGKFTSSSTALNDLFTQSNVTFNNPDDFYQQDIATYTDKLAESRQGFRLQNDVVKFGCTNEAEALAFAKWQVDTAQTQTETITFNITGAHYSIRPGDVFEVFDKKWMGRDFSGRLYNGLPELGISVTEPSGVLRYRLSADKEFDGGDITMDTLGNIHRNVLGYFKVKLEKPITLDAGQTYTMTFNVGDEFCYKQFGTTFLKFEIDSRTVVGSPTDIIYLKNRSDLTPLADFSYTNNAGEVITKDDIFIGPSYIPANPFYYPSWISKPLTFYSIQSNKIAPRTYTCMNIREIRPNEFEITGVIYDKTKFSRVEENIVLPKTPTRIPSAIGGTVSSPKGMSFRVVGVTVGGVAQNNLIVNWPFVDGALSYQVYYTVNGGSSVGPFSVDVPEFTLANAANGVYVFTVRAVNAVGGLSTPTSGTYTVVTSNPVIIGGGSTGGTDTGDQGQPASNPTTSTSGFSKPTNLRLDVSGGGTSYVTNDVPLTWDAPTPVSGLVVAHYEVTFVNIATSVVRRREIVTDNHFTYTFGQNQGDGLTRTFKVQVRAIDNLGNFTQAVEATFNNPAPAVPAFVSLTNSNNVLTLTHAASVDSDAQGTIVCVSTTSGFTPDLSNKVDESAGTTHSIQAQAETTYYVRYAIYDSFTNLPDQLTFSPEYTITTGKDFVQLDPIVGVFSYPQVSHVYPIFLSVQSPFQNNKLWGKTSSGTGTIAYRVNGTVVATLNLSTTLNSVSFTKDVMDGDSTDIMVTAKSTDGFDFSWQLDCTGE